MSQHTSAAQTRFFILSSQAYADIMNVYDPHSSTGLDAEGL